MLFEGWNRKILYDYTTDLEYYESIQTWSYAFELYY